MPYDFFLSFYCASMQIGKWAKFNFFIQLRIDFRLPKPHPTAPAKLSVSDVAFKNTMLQVIKSQDETVLLLVENKVWVIIIPRVFV